MRRLFITIVALFIMIFSFAFQSALADVDLSGMSFDELVALKSQIDLALMSSDESFYAFSLFYSNKNRGISPAARMF